MEPITRKDRAAFQNGPRMSVASVNDNSTSNINDFLMMPTQISDNYNEDNELSFLKDAKPVKKLSDEDIKIKALNLAINIAKLMSDVTVDSVLKIAGKVAVYIKK